MAGRTLKLKQILEEAKLQASYATSSQLPSIERGLGQIEAETQLLANRAGAQEPDSRAHSLLAESGINTQALTRNANAVNTENTFEAIVTTHSLNVDEYLDKVHQESIIHAIDEGRRNAHCQFQAAVEQQMHADVRAFSRQVLEEWDHHQANVIVNKDAAFAIKSVDLRKRLGEYAAVISKLNDARLLDQAIPLESQLRRLSISTPALAQDRMTDAWDIVEHLATHAKGCMFGRNPRQPPAQTYINRSLVTASRTWLEKQFVRYMDKNIREVGVGGSPSFPRRLRAYVGKVFNRTDRRLEFVEGIPMWVYVYFLLRSGHSDAALAYVTDNEAFFGECSNDLQEYLLSEERSVSRREILTEYRGFKYGTEQVDPYKILVYKILGRCELHDEHTPEIIKNREDYLWLHLTLVRDYAEGYSLERKGPWLQFQTLLLTLQFERAVDYLYKHQKYRPEAVHFAVALAYAGMLTIPKEPLKSGMEILLIEDGMTARLNFSRLLLQYIRTYSLETQDALHYIYLFTLFANDDMTQLCYQNICDVVLASPHKSKTILGTQSTEHVRQPGLLDRHKALIGIACEKDFVNRIVRPVGEKLAQQDHHVEAVQTYELASDYDTISDLLSKQLSDAFQQNAANAKDVITFALDTLKTYDAQQHIGSVLDEGKKHTVRLLVDLLWVRGLYNAKKYDQALERVAEMGLVPLHDKYSEIQLAARQIDKLDDHVSKALPDLLLMVMDMLYKTWKTFDQQPAVQSMVSTTMLDLENSARAVLSFVGMIQFKMPADTVARLNKAELLMSVGRGKQQRSH